MHRNYTIPGGAGVNAVMDRNDAAPTARMALQTRKDSVNSCTPGFRHSQVLCVVPTPTQRMWYQND